MRTRNTAELYYGEMSIRMFLVDAIWLGFVLYWYHLAAGDIGAKIFLTVSYSPFIALLVYYTVQYICYRNAKLSDIQTVRLDRTTTHGFTRRVGFVINASRGEDVIYGAVTKQVFTAWTMITAVPLDRYAGRDLRVGYYEKRHEWIVLAE